MTDTPPDAARSARRVLFVAGLGHSGSTLLHLLLAASGRAVGIGEAEQTMRYATPPDRTCTCGVLAAECAVWGPVLGHPPATGSDDVGLRYRRLMTHLDEVLDPDVMVVDASKNPTAVEGLLESTANVDAVLLVRDVRSWTSSSRRRAARTGRLDVRTALARRDLHLLAQRRKLTGWSRFTLWEARNLAIEKRLQELEILRAVVGYEQLATAPEATLRRLCHELELEFDEVMLRPSEGIGHVLQGNLPALDPSKTASISYSTDWLIRRDWVLPAALRPRVMTTNTRLVYRSGEPTPVRVAEPVASPVPEGRR